jgi:hypothetical protein
MYRTTADATIFSDLEGVRAVGAQMFGTRQRVSLQETYREKHIESRAAYFFLKGNLLARKAIYEIACRYAFTTFLNPIAKDAHVRAPRSNANRGYSCGRAEFLTNAF